MRKPHRNTSPGAEHQAGRRRLLQGTGAWVGLSGVSGLSALAISGVAQAQTAPAAEAAEPPRLALLIGNRDYPEGEDLPPIHKNVRRNFLYCAPTCQAREYAVSAVTTVY